MAKRSAQDVAILSNRAAELLESGLTIAEVASQLDVSTRTVQRWRNRTQFSPIARPEIEQKSHIEVADPIPDGLKYLPDFKIATNLESLIPVALDELRRILENPESRTADKLRACGIIGDWSGLNGGLYGSIRRVFGAGYVVVDPRRSAEKDTRTY
jgi:transposase-like protein